MTLNIAVVHPESLYIAADFRLSRLVRGRTSPMDEPSMKLVRYFYPACMGLITYTGFGAGDDGAATAVHICRWLEGLPDLTIDDVAEIIRSRGDEWLRRMRPFPFKQTFVVAGFESDGKATLSMISNFQAMNRPTSDQPGRSLVVSTESTRAKAILRVTGVSGVVTRERQRLLRRTVDANALDSARIKQAMMSMIRRASKSPESADLIGPNSSAVSLQPGGSGHQDLSEPSDVDMHFVFDGAVMPSTRAMLRERGLTGRRLVGATFASTGSVPYRQDRCVPKIGQGASPGVHDLVELQVPGEPPFIAQAIDASGAMLCSSTIEGRPGHLQYWILRWPDDIQRIPLPEPAATSTGGFDGRGNIYVQVGAIGKAQRLARWNSKEFVLLPTVEDNSSIVQAVSLSGWLAGFVETSKDATRADRQQPARWTPDGDLERATGVPAGMAGSATSVADDGTALVQLHRDLNPLTSHLWSPNGALQPLNLPLGDLAIGITDEQSFVGFHEDVSGRKALFSVDGSTWTDLDTPHGWAPDRCFADGMVAGRVMVDGFYRPWIKSWREPEIVLPVYADHHGSVTGTNADGDLVGTIQADHCCHAVLWRRRS